jgi:hypothetical protein
MRERFPQQDKNHSMQEFASGLLICPVRGVQLCRIVAFVIC